MANKWKNQHFGQALKNAFHGIIHAVKTQRNLKIQIIFAIIVIILGIFFNISMVEWAILVLTISIVLVAEFINTAIETTVDLYTESYNEKAKNAKDVAAGAVLMASLAAVIIGILLFGTHLIEYVFTEL